MMGEDALMSAFAAPAVSAHQIEIRIQPIANRKRNNRHRHAMAAGLRAMSPEPLGLAVLQGLTDRSHMGEARTSLQKTQKSRRPFRTPGFFGSFTWGWGGRDGEAAYPLPIFLAANSAASPTTIAGTRISAMSWIRVGTSITVSESPNHGLMI